MTAGPQGDIASAAGRRSGDDQLRLAALDRYGILDTPAEVGFDDIVLLACQICQAPVALVSLVAEDRQWFKARIGFEPSATPLDQSVCQHAMKEPGLLVIPDLTLDPRTRANTLVTGSPHIRFYAGARLQSPDGHPLGALCVIDRVPRPEGLTPAQAIGLQALARQVMSQMELQRIMLVRDAQRDRLWRSSQDLLVAIDTKGRFVAVNPAVTPILGWAPEDLIGRSVFDFVVPEDTATTDRALATAAKGSLPVTENRYRHKDGGHRWLSWVAAPEGDLIFATGRHVTAEKMAATALAASIADRDRIWRHAHDLIVIVDMRGMLRAVNPASVAILGWPPEAMLGKSVLDFIHPDDRPPLLSGGGFDPSRYAKPGLFENRYRHSDGNYRLLSLSTSMEDELVYCYGRDVTAERDHATALRLVEEQLRQSQKMEAVGQLTGGVAHDFNNLLTVIRSSVDLLKRPNLAEERRQRYIEAISDTTLRAAKLTGQLLAFARRQALKPEVFDAVESVRAIGDMVVTLTGSRISIVTELPEQPCYVNADLSQFDTAIVNLSVNAKDAMNGEGTLTISVGTTSSIPPLRAHPAVRGDFVTVSVTDTGSGITPDVIEHVFEPFFTTKGVGQGTGLGLSQVFGFVKQSGGEVMVVSAVGRGTTFTLFLPRIERAAESQETIDDQTAVDGHGTCVLVVEDNEAVGSFARQTLEELGYRSVLARDASAALTELAADASRFDVVFSDVVMPGMSGIELGQDIRRRHPDLPVVLTSGYSHVLAQNGTYGFELLQKPYSIEQLSRVLQKAAHWRRLKRVIDG